MRPFVAALGALRFSWRSLVVALLVLLPMIALLAWIEVSNFQRELQTRRMAVKSQVEAASVLFARRTWVGEDGGVYRITP